MLTVFVILAVAALIITIVAAIGKAPLWVAVVLLAIIECLRALPLGRIILFGVGIKTLAAGAVAVLS